MIILIKAIDCSTLFSYFAYCQAEKYRHVAARYPNLTREIQRTKVGKSTTLDVMLVYAAEVTYICMAGTGRTWTADNNSII